jgi:hypothetical protein
MAQSPEPPRRNFSLFSKNNFNVHPGEPAFEIATNLCDWFELGIRDGNDYWLEGQIVGDGEFLFNGRLFLRNGTAGTIIDNFPRGPMPEGWTRRQRVDEEGYELISNDGVVLFGYRVHDKICHVAVNLYAVDGEIVAESVIDELRIYRPPMRIGRGGVVWE